MCDRCEALQEEVSYLRERLGEQLNKDLVRVMMKTFGVTHGEGSVIVALFQARGALMSGYALGDTVRLDHSRTYDSNTVQVFIMRVRQKTSPDFIVTYPRVGYALSDAARLAIVEAIKADTVAATAAEPVPLKVGVTWDARRIGELSRLHFKKGLYFSECARIMKISRNACIGAANRYLRDEGQRPYA